MVIKQVALLMAMMIMMGAYGEDNNLEYDPCSDAKVSKSDGFSFGLVFSAKDTFFFNKTQLSPCDSRLSLAGTAQLAVFRPKIDEISLLTINSTTLSKSSFHMVAFGGRKFAARSIPIFVADDNVTVTSFTLVLEFERGTLQNLFWKNFGCDSCTGDSLACVNGTQCAVLKSKCKSNGGPIGCDIGIQLAFSGSDENNNVLNSWYEVSHLRQYSLYSLYSDLRNSLTSPFKNLW